MFTIYYQDYEDLFFIGYTETEAEAKSAIEKLRANDFEKHKVEIQNEFSRIGKQLVEEADALEALLCNSRDSDEMAQAIGKVRTFEKETFGNEIGKSFRQFTTEGILKKYTFPYVYSSKLQKL